MPPACDHIADSNGVDLVRFSRLYEFPDFVKQADMDREFQPGPLPVTTYADPVHRQFPCATKASTWLSALYFHEKQAEYHPKDREQVRERLEGFVDWWGIRPAYSQMVARHDAMNKTAEVILPDSSYALVWVEHDTGHKHRDYPLRNSKEVQAAAEWLYEWRDKVPFADRHVIATKILEKAAEFGTGLWERNEFLEKQAGCGVGDPMKVAAMIKSRAYLADKEEHKQGILKLAEEISRIKRVFLVPELLVKLAETVDTIDRTLGLPGKYTNVIRRPEDVIFEATFTKAAEELAEHCELTSGTIYDKGTLSKVALDDLQSLFGQDFATQVRSGLNVDAEKLAAVVATLPRGDAMVFDAMMKEVGLLPQGKTASAAAVNWNDEVWEKVAAEYQPQ